MTTENQTPEVSENSAPQPSAPLKNNKKGIAVAIAAAVVVVGGIAIGSMADAKAENKVAELVEKIESEEKDVKISYGSVEVGLLSSAIDISDLKFSKKDGGEVFNIDGLSVQAKGYVENEQIPYLGNISIDNLKIVDDRVLNELQAETGIDYSDKAFNIDFGYEFKEKKDTFNATFSLGVSDLNSIDFSANISGVKESWEHMQSAYKENKGEFDLTRTQTGKIKQGLQGASFNDMTLSYVNKGEIEQLMEHAAEENGITVEQFKQQAPLGIDQYLGDTELSSEIKKFVNEPEKLTISIKPESPIKFAEVPALAMSGMMGQIESVMARLNIEVEAN